MKRKIFAVGMNSHDHSTYDGDYHYVAERFSREKMNHGHDADFYHSKVVHHLKNADVFAFSRVQKYYKNHLERKLHKYMGDINDFVPLKLWDHLFLDDRIYYCDHHQAHAALAFIESGFEESDILAIDGGGYQFACAFIDKDQNIHDLTRQLPVGNVWKIAVVACGMGGAAEGKVMGLAAYGKVNEDIIKFLNLMILHDPWDTKTMAKELNKVSTDKFEIAASVQEWTYRIVRKYVKQYKSCDKICVTGGVAYNGYMNEMLASMYEDIHVASSPGDEGQSVGVYVHADYNINGNRHIPPMYRGKAYNVDETLLEGLKFARMPMEEIYPWMANEIAEGAVIGWFQGRSETGNRALGNRSILADPRRTDIKDYINTHIKFREDWRPFAPSVLIERYKEFFDTPVPSPYMSRIMTVTSDAIPGVTHIDGSARIQTVDIKTNPHYHKLISAFDSITGIPMLVNTSFNCQEPIVETPEHAIATFKKTNLNFLVINDYVIWK